VKAGAEKIITKNGESYVALIDSDRLDYSTAWSASASTAADRRRARGWQTSRRAARRRRTRPSPPCRSAVPQRRNRPPAAKRG